MQFRSIVVCVSLVVCSFGVAYAEDKKNDSKKDDLQGTWIPVTAEVGGKPFPEELRKSIKLVIKDGKYTVTLGSQVDQGTAKVDSQAKPKTIDITGTDGPNKGKTILAIYELDGETFRVCYDLTGKNRPTAFETKEGTQLFLVNYKRESR